LYLLRCRLGPFLPILAAALIAAGCGGAARPARPAATGTALISMFEPDVLAGDPGPTLDVLHRLGVQDVRVMVRWRDVAPDASRSVPPPRFDPASPAAYPAANWAPYDALVRAAVARHMGVLLNVTGGAPRWATGPGAPPEKSAPGVWRPSASQFEPFVRAVGLRYSGAYTPPGATSPLPRVSFWSIWNEPNLGEADLAPQTTDSSQVEASSAMYRQLLDAGWSGLHQSGHGHDTILIGELAPYGQTEPSNVFPGVFGEMVPLRFVRALYCVDSSFRPLQGPAAAARGCPTSTAGSRSFASQHPALFEASGFAMHPYPSGGVPPNVVLPRLDDDPDFVYLATLSRLTRFLDRVTAVYGAGTHFPIYSTEYGYLTNPPFIDGAPANLAPAYLNQAEYMSWRDPRLRSWDQYLLADPGPGSNSEFVTGLEYANGQPKPSYYAYRLPIYLPSTAQRGNGGLEVWGCVRPAYYEGFPQSAKIELQPAGHGAFKAVGSATVSGPSCYFDLTVHFPSAGNVRLAWSYPGGPLTFSRLVAITVT
jgi:hypothetical protein